MKGYGKDIFNVNVVVKLGNEVAIRIAELLTVRTLEEKLVAITEILSLKLSSGTTIFLISEIIRRKYDSRLSISNKIKSLINIEK